MSFFKKPAADKPTHPADRGPDDTLKQGDRWLVRYVEDDATSDEDRGERTTRVMPVVRDGEPEDALRAMGTCGCIVMGTAAVFLLFVWLGWHLVLRINQ